MISVAINGYGRIGRLAHRIILLEHPELQVVAINAGHRANILSKDFGKVGIGATDAGIYGEMFV